jgi:hypothetical protein
MVKLNCGADWECDPAAGAVNATWVERSTVKFADAGVVSLRPEVSNA